MRYYNEKRFKKLRGEKENENEKDGIKEKYEKAQLENYKLQTKLVNLNNEFDLKEFVCEKRLYINISIEKIIYFE